MISINVPIELGLDWQIQEATVWMCQSKSSMNGQGIAFQMEKFYAIDNLGTTGYQQ
jgi:hypothetical protein